MIIKLFTITLLAMLSIVPHCLSSQSVLPIKKNVIKASAAFYSLIVGAASLDYERNLTNTDHTRLNVEATYGIYYRNVSKAPFMSVGKYHSFTTAVNGLLGTGSHFAELSGGVRFSFITEHYRDDLSPWAPVLTAGYRYQHPQGKGIVFRAFAGTTGFGISLGKAF